MGVSTITRASNLALVEEEFLSPGQVAELFPGLTANTLAMWRKYDVGPSFIRMGRRVFYPRGLLQEWCDAHLHVCRPEIRNLRPRR